nr:uncharacterized protein LOC117833972 [Setaria viridis]
MGPRGGNAGRPAALLSAAPQTDGSSRSTPDQVYHATKSARGASGEPPGTQRGRSTAAPGRRRRSRTPLAASASSLLAGRGSPPSSVAMSAAVSPSWMLLEPFVFRKDDDESFPDEGEAPIRATGTTSWGAQFRIAFSLAKPPQISRLYAQLPVPGFLDRNVGTPLSIVATHRHLALVRVATRTSEMVTVQNFFIFTADEGPSSSLKALPLCTEPEFDYTRHSVRVPRRRRLPDGTPRLLNVRNLGFWCRGKQFVVVELTLFKPINHDKVFADICLLHSDRDQLGATWKSMRVEFLSTDDPDDADLFQISWWCTEAVIPFDKWLCWIDYHRGILFCDMSKLPNPPTVSFIWFPLDRLPISGNRTGTSTMCYRSVSVVDRGRALKFVNITRHDGIPFEALKPGTGFTITCHTLVLGRGSMAWKEDYTVTSGELWEANTPERLPRCILMFPRVDIDRPHVVHFLYIEFGYYACKKMWVVSIDMSTKTVESFSLYINGHEGLETDDADLIDLIERKSVSPWPFLPCEFPKFLNLSRKRKHME